MTTAQCMVLSQSVCKLNWLKTRLPFHINFDVEKSEHPTINGSGSGDSCKAVINLLAAQTAAAVGFPKWSLIRWNQWWPDDAPIDIFLFNVWMSGCVSTKVSKSVYCALSLSLSLILHTFLLCTLQFTSKMEKKQQVRLDCSDSKIVLVLMISENG